MSARHDVSLQFWPDGSMSPHRIEDVVAVCVGLSRHLPDFPKCVCRSILWYGSTYAQILSRTHNMLSTSTVAGDKFVMFSPLGLSCSPSLSCSPTDYATDACSLRRIFATFLADLSTSLDRPYFYLIQCNGWKSLCLLTGLSVQDYSKLLLQSKLVLVRNNKDGSRSIRVDRDEWNLFLGWFQLREDIYGQGGCVELTDGKIKHAAIKRTMGGRIGESGR
jgi:hypothetical protein